jgi:hypothetical protein
MADALFELPRLAQVYDPLDGNRDDLDAYVARPPGPRVRLHRPPPWVTVCVIER